FPKLCFSLSTDPSNGGVALVIGVLWSLVVAQERRPPSFSYCRVCFAAYRRDCFALLSSVLSENHPIMDDFQTGEETAFITDEVKNIVKDSIESTVGTSTYSHNKVQQWTSSVIEQCLNHLTKLGKPFKYVVTCVIMQKSGAGLHTASSCYWDSATDGSCTVKWENKSMYFIVTVFGLAI
ncbi:Dynein molecular motor protein light chain, partial [Fasciola gigantica]